MPEVLNSRKEWDLDRNQVLIDRTTKWGNPFIIPKDGDRTTVIRMYREYLNTRPDLLAALPELAGKDLVCWCAPRPCHGDILLALANPDD